MGGSGGGIKTRLLSCARQIDEYTTIAVRIKVKRAIAFNEVTLLILLLAKLLHCESVSDNS
jgi:hypothetical protein